MACINAPWLHAVIHMIQSNAGIIHLRCAHGAEYGQDFYKGTYVLLKRDTLGLTEFYLQIQKGNVGHLPRRSLLS
jgi:hypothetical protein